MKNISVLPLLLAFAVCVFADVPPACLLSAVNTQDDPGDLAAVCGKEATDVQKAIASICGANQSVAQSAFIATCSGAGSSVAPYTATSTSSNSLTSGTSSSSGTIYVTSGTGGAAATATATVTGSASATSSTGGSSATGNAAADVKQVGSFAAAAIAIAGVVAVL
ncbi:hypothetical protein A1O1_06399 [Capronia coronata CBS 617.96]|uniref:Extracellular membrane protein CFEM domain-containing protein n=1 Tax=Capronia coronata CBS 617.96 TaxID=1182541 RepID=W9Y8S3_9EURO|nr:uncharacterized protein A1O1_06399 [Capronia coronata CBS 617.96]EXJ86030.1 hypothetical protein A1O1_06399 [Capronia coronata CBS 617.96]